MQLFGERLSAVERQAIIMTSAPLGLGHPMASLNGLVNAHSSPYREHGWGRCDKFKEHQESGA